MQYRPTLIDLYTEAVEQLTAQTESAKAHSRILPFINELADKWGKPGPVITGNQRAANVDFAFGLGTHNALVLSLCCPEGSEPEISRLLKEVETYPGVHSMSEIKNESCRELRYTFKQSLQQTISLVIQIWKGQCHAESISGGTSESAEALRT